MNKASLLMLVLILLLAAGGFLVWGGGDTGNSLPNAPVATLEDEPQTAEPFRVNTAGAIDDAEADGELPEGLRRIVLEQANPRDINPTMVQVVEGRTGVPAPEVDVYFIDGFEGSELTDPFAQHWSALAEDRGLRFKTDPQGLVELPAIRDWAIVTAQREGAYGFAKLGPEHRDVETIALRPDETVTVRVVDGEDRPAPGVPVGVIQHVPVRQETAQWAEQLKVLEQQMAEVLRYIEANPDQRQEAGEKLGAMRQQAARLEGPLGEAKREVAAQKTGKLPAPPRIGNKPSATTGTELRAQRLTDEDGIAVFRHFQLYRHEREKSWPESHVDQFEAALLMPLQKPESVAFAGRPVPSETLELRLPPIGSIALRTVDLDGRPFSHPVQAVLTMLSETATWARVQVGKEQGEGELEFPFVGLGLQFTAQCRLEKGPLKKGGKGRFNDGRFPWDTPPFLGPVSPGERVIVDLVVAPDAGMLFGRLVDDTGQPLAGASPTFALSSQAGELAGEKVTLDAEGHFHLPFRLEERHQPPFRLEIRKANVKPTAGMAMTLAMLAEGRVTDLGDLRMADLGGIAHGRVVDDLGQPIAGALLQLQRERQVEGRQQAPRTRTREPQGPQTRMEFVDEAFVADRTDFEGNYQLFGELAPGRYRLRVQSKDHFLLETQDVQPGQRVDLELLRNSRLIGTVVTPDWMPDSSVRAHLELATDPQQQREDQVRSGKGTDETFVYFDWVRPGVYNLSLTVQDFPDPILSIDGLEILPGQQDVHPRLRDLDLGAFVYHFEVSAVDEHGQPFKPSAPVLIARITGMDGRAGFVGFAWGGGSQAEIISASPQLEVIPFSVGYRAQRTVLSPGFSQLQYLRIPPVELHMPGLRALVGTTTVYVTAELVEGADLPDSLETWDGRSARIANWYRESRSTWQQLPQGDSVELSVMVDGRYRVTAHLGDKKVSVQLGEVDVRLEPGAAPQRVTVNYDAEAVQAGLDQLDGR